MHRDAAKYLSVVRWEAGKLARKGLPNGVDVSDLESAGNEVLAECLAGNPVGDETRFLAHLRLCLRTRLVDEIRRITHRGLANMGTLTGYAGDQIAVADKHAPDPATSAAVAELIEGLPMPGQVAVKAARLRKVMLDAVSESDLAEMVAAQVAKAKKGNGRAFALVTKLFTEG